MGVRGLMTFSSVAIQILNVVENLNDVQLSCIIRP